MLSAQMGCGLVCHGPVRVTVPWLHWRSVGQEPCLWGPPDELTAMVAFSLGPPTQDGRPKQLAPTFPRAENVTASGSQVQAHYSLFCVLEPRFWSPGVALGTINESKDRVGGPGGG